MCLRTASAWVHDRRRQLPWKQRHDPKSLTGKPAYSALPSQTPQIRSGSRRTFGTTSQSCFEKQRTRPKVVRQECCSRWVLGRSRRGAEQILLFEPLLHSAHLPGRLLPRQYEPRSEARRGLRSLRSGNFFTSPHKFRLQNPRLSRRLRHWRISIAPRQAAEDCQPGRCTSLRRAPRSLNRT
jgi:hypothetical protein